MDWKVRALRAAELDVPEDTLQPLADIGHEQTLERHDYLFHKGDPSNALYVLAEGVLQAVSTSYEGQDLVFGEFGPGKVIGELTVLDGAPRSASIRAVASATLLAIDRGAFLELAQKDSGLALGLAALCAKRAKRLSTWAEGASFADTIGRLAVLLVGMAEAQEGADATDTTRPLKFKVTQQTLADQLGITRESANKALRSLEEEGLVSLGRGSLTILDLDELQWRGPA